MQLNITSDDCKEGFWLNRGSAPALGAEREFTIGVGPFFLNFEKESDAVKMAKEILCKMGEL